MDSMAWIFAACLALGSLVGFLAGLLGIGGGMLIVPALIYLLPLLGIHTPHLTHIAIATSLAAIILTSLSSVRAHQKHHNIQWPIFWQIIPGILVGASLSGFIAELIPAKQLQQIFAVFVMIMALQMSLSFKPHSVTKGIPKKSVLFPITFVMALIAGFMGIGGGALLVPFLTWRGLQMRYAVGLSSVVGLAIATSGSVGYILAGLDAQSLPDNTLGFVYLPALFGIVISSTLMAPVGVHAATTWSTPVLKKIFAFLLLVIGIELILN